VVREEDGLPWSLVLAEDGWAGMLAVGGVAGLCFAKRLTKKAWDSDDFWAFVAVGCGLWVVVGFDCGDSGCDRCGG
jgi:hypothetical protein